MIQKKIESYYDKNQGEKPERFFEHMLVYPDGSKAGQPFILEQFQKDFLRDTNGTFETKRNVLQYKHCYLEIAKGNGKTPMMAGLALLHSGWSGIVNGEIYFLAGTRKQAGILLDDCKKMIRLSPNLQGEFIVQSQKIFHKKTNTRIEALSSEAGAHHGLRPDKVFADETHVWTDAGELYHTLVEALGKKVGAQMFMITTAGVINTFPEELSNYAKKIQSKIIVDPTWYAKIYGGDPNDDPFDETKWINSNPGLGTIKDLDEMRAMAYTASQMPVKLNSFKRLQLNVWTSSVTSWMQITLFDTCNQGEINLKRHRKKQTPCYCGLDLASTDDLSAFSMLFVETNKKGKVISADWVCYFWCPNDTILKKSRDNQVNYPLWVKDGLMFATPGSVQDKNEIFEFIQRANEDYNIKIVNVDLAAHRSVVGAWGDESTIPFEGHSQGIMAMSQPTKDLSIWIGKKKINHAGNEVLRWQITECEAFTDANENIKLMKGIGHGKGAGQRRKKIDGIISGVMALSGYLSQPEDEYDETWV